MFVIPAAGPGEDQVPDTSSLEGVVSAGPHEAAASAPRASRKRVLDLGRAVIGVEWALQDSNLRPSDYESAALTD